MPSEVGFVQAGDECEAHPSTGRGANPPCLPWSIKERAWHSLPSLLWGCELEVSVGRAGLTPARRGRRGIGLNSAPWSRRAACACHGILLGCSGFTVEELLLLDPSKEPISLCMWDGKSKAPEEPRWHWRAQGLVSARSLQPGLLQTNKPGRDGLAQPACGFRLLHRPPPWHSPHQGAGFLHGEPRASSSGSPPSASPGTGGWRRRSLCICMGGFLVV